MCTPITIDTPNVDLSGSDTKTATDPAGTGTATPGPDAVPTGSTASNGTVVNTPGAKLPNGVPINGGVALPETNDTGDGAVVPATADGVPAPDGSTPMGSDTAGKKGTPGADGGTPGVPATAVDQNTLLINSLTEMAHKFTDTTASILSAQTDATNALKSGFMDLTQQQRDALKAADDLRKNTGQASRKPNYSLSLSANKRANSRGVSSTLLTGPTGVPTNQLALGRAQLLGGQSA